MPRFLKTCQTKGFYEFFGCRKAPRFGSAPPMVSCFSKALDCPPVVCSAQAILAHLPCPLSPELKRALPLTLRRERLQCLQAPIEANTAALANTINAGFGVRSRRFTKQPIFSSCAHSSATCTSICRVRCTRRGIHVHVSFAEPWCNASL